jgi:choline dehydrogenase-like flavoprotein
MAPISELSPRQRAVLDAVCDTFVPPGEGGGSALHDGVLGVIAALQDPQDRRRLGQLLSALGSPLVNAALSGVPRSFASLGLEERVRLLRGWAESRMQLRRAGFQVMKRLVSFVHYTTPDADGSHPAWREVGYPGPLPPPPGPPPARLPAVEIDRETTLDCDVVVVGSGAGGGVAAGVLAAAGRSVVVLEKGENLGPGDFSYREAEAFRAGYLDGGMLMTQSASMPILAGSCVGGGTTVNWTTSFALREATRAEWDERAGLSLFAGPRMEESFRRVLARSGVNLDHSAPGVRDQILERGLRALGWHVDVIPRNATGCPSGRECGYCGFGCRPNAKNSTAKTYLADAVAAGARIVPGCEADRVLVEGGRAVGVAARVTTRDGRKVPLAVRARAVVAACGTIHTPGLLARSGLTSPHLGRNLHLHPVTAVAGNFPERVEPWSGHLQTRHSDQLANQDGRWYGAKLETGPIHWALPASAYGWEDPVRHRAEIGKLAHSCAIGILLRDRDAGRVVTGRDGRPRAHYELSAYDARHLRAAMLGAAEVVAAAGAEEITTLQQPPVRVRPGTPGWREAFAAGVDARGLDRCRMALISFHQMGTARIGADPARGVVDEAGETFEVRGLYVADGSAFVTSSGVNPMITIMAVADHVARGIAERW